ncbi:MAG: FHA domain-containing protein [Litoreibacter sp.]
MMSFIRDLISRKRDGKSEEQMQINVESAASDVINPDPLALRTPPAEKPAAPIKTPSLAELAAEQMKAEASAAAEKSQPAPNPVPAAPVAKSAKAPERSSMIWDIEDDEFIPDRSKKEKPAAMAAPAPAAPPAAPTPAAPPKTAASARQRRTKTRLIGFDKSGGDVVDLFDASAKPAAEVRAKFPVGWILVTEGEGRGECFTLFTGLSQIGRDEGQAVQLDFGDSAISRSNHAAIVFDAENKKFFVGHGGKSNIVRHNDKPLISNEELKDGDTLRIGETTLKFKAFCGEDFNWTSSDQEGDEDVAIA